MGDLQVRMDKMKQLIADVLVIDEEIIDFDNGQVGLLLIQNGNYTFRYWEKKGTQVKVVDTEYFAVLAHAEKRYKIIRMKYLDKFSL